MPGNTKHKAKSIIAIFLIFIGCNTNGKKKETEPGKIKVTKHTANNKVLQAPAEYFKLIKQLIPIHEKLSKAKPGEWLYHHSGKGMSFKQYIQSNPVRPDSQRNKIYLLPLGDFSKTGNKLIKLTAEYLQVFYNVSVIIKPGKLISVISGNARRKKNNTEQLLTKHILYKILLPELPENAVVYNAITSSDLYPSDDWNYVFGQSSLHDRVGVSSFFRFKEPHWQNDTTEDFKITLSRLIKTVSHEIGNNFSIKHCIDYKCIMNGSNSLTESDRKPLYLCPECMSKVCWCCNYDIIDRYKRILHFFEENDLKPYTKFYKKSLKILEQTNSNQNE